MRKLAALGVPLVASLLFAACGGAPATGNPGPGDGQVEIRLTDAPAPNGLMLLLTLEDFQIKSGSEWHTIVKKPATVDLLTLVGKEQTMGAGNVPAGQYTRVRFRISNPTIAHEGGETPSGLKVERPELPMEASVQAGKTTILVVDIDGAESFAFENEKPVFDVQAKVTVRPG